MKKEHSQSNDRRNFIFAFSAALISLPVNRRFSAFASRADEPFTLEVGASPMRARADAVRLDLINSHIIPGKSYPIPKAFHSSTMLPTNRKIANQLLSRGSLVLSGDRFINVDSNGPNTRD